MSDESDSDLDDEKRFPVGPTHQSTVSTSNTSTVGTSNTSTVGNSNISTVSTSDVSTDSKPSWSIDESYKYDFLCVCVCVCENCLLIFFAPLCIGITSVSCRVIVMMMLLTVQHLLMYHYQRHQDPQCNT